MRLCVCVCVCVRGSGVSVFVRACMCLCACGRGVCARVCASYSNTHGYIRNSDTSAIFTKVKSKNFEFNSTASQSLFATSTTQTAFNAMWIYS